MLARAFKLNFEGLRDSAKQLLIWSKYKKAEFCTSFHLDRDSDDSDKNKLYQKRDEFRSFYEDDEWYSNENKRKPNLRRRSFFNDGNNDWKSPNRRSFNNFNLINKNISFSEQLKPHVKNFYQPHPDVLNRSTEEINEFRKKHDIQILGRSSENCPPILNFNELSLPSGASDVIRRLNYSNPTPVQSQTWPIALSGHNMVGISRTGSGKTLGFVLPALLHIKHQPPLEKGEGPIALIIAPTRELVQQILKVILPFARSFNFDTATLFGGAAKRQQIEHMLRGVEICVATPGRLNDLLSQNYVKLDRCTYFVLDEADRLLDMGFHPQIKSAFHYCRPDRQVLMWSATWPKEVQSLAGTFLEDFIIAKFGSAELAANPNINQIIHICEEREKFNLLKDLLQKINETDDNKTLIFVGTKLKADHLGFLLSREGYKTVTIHGDKTQRSRDSALKIFRMGEVKILVGTEVVGRGIDIEDIRYVINYDFPIDVETYVHNIGRTARKDKSGTSHSFFTFNDRPKAHDLIKILNQANQPVDPKLQEMVQPQFYDRSRKRIRYSRHWNENY